jgi:hypothetical protein
MYARVARWEGAEGEAMRRTAEQINSDATSGPPEGVPAKGFMMLIDPDKGQGLAITLFETEDDLRTGDEALNSMNPPGEGLGHRVSVEMYEVGVDARI